MIIASIKNRKERRALYSAKRSKRWMLEPCYLKRVKGVKKCIRLYSDSNSRIGLERSNSVIGENWFRKHCEKYR